MKVDEICVRHTLHADAHRAGKVMEKEMVTMQSRGETNGIKVHMGATIYDPSSLFISVRLMNSVCSAKIRCASKFHRNEGLG